MYSCWQEGDPRVKDYFLMGSPAQPILIMILYLAFVLKIGPHLMKKRQPYKLTLLMSVYNVTQIIGNLWVFLMCLATISPLSIWCSPPSKSNSLSVLYVIKGHYLYVLLKFYDFVETIFFVLRKKEKQISFLHVVHHIVQLSVSWFSGNYFPGGQPCFCATLNTFIHLIMYTYYLISSWIDAKYLWWKKYLTSLQIFQHYVIFLLYGIPLVNPYCTYPKPFLLFNTVFIVLMTYLFKKFYQKSYTKEDKKPES